MKRPVLLAACFAASMLDTGNALSGQPLCTSHDHMIVDLATRYKETTVAVGLENRGALLELLTSADGATWSLIVTGPEGNSCIVAAGENWQTRERAPDDPQL